MDARTVADVEGWESRPFGGGYDGLHALAGREFTGAVVAGDAYLFMVRGRVVGVFDCAESAAGEISVEPADIGRFEDADGTAYEAPHEALALLFAMAASDGETRGRYYSKDTPLEEVDGTLRDGGFTGYLELSENVLSGDYYLVYHGGRRRSVAFVGQSRRLKTDEEAFDLAADEVGIYEVTAVPLSTVELPGSPASDDTAAVPDAGPAPGGEGGVGGPDEVPPDDAAGSAEGTGSPGAAGSDTPAEGADIDLGAAMTPGTTEDETVGGAGTTDAPAAPSDAAADDESGSHESPAGTEPDPAGDAADSGAGETPDFDELLGSDDGDAGGAPAGGGETEGGDTDETAVAEGTDADETGALHGTDVPAAGNDSGAGPPDRDEGEPDAESAVSAVPDEAVGSGAGPSDPSETPGEATPEDVEAAAAAAEATIDDGERAGVDTSDAEPEPTEAGTEPTGAGAGPREDAESPDDGRVVPSVDPDRTARAPPPEGAPEGGKRMIDGETVAGLRSELAAREDRIEELRGRLESVEAERDELADRVAELERRLEESGAAPLGNTREMSPAEALSGTSVLVRYRSRSEPTLADAHDGEATRDALAANLVLEPHATFETDGLAVAGRTFESFLEGSQGYAFLRWLVGEFPYEIRDTGSVRSLEPLYDALPTLDRAEFDAAVTLEGADREAARFDLVGRDRQGDPLFVAHLEDDRAPTNAATIGEFLTEATAAAESHESLVAAFAVTASYFEPEALSTAEDATGGSLLSRSKRRSFVNTSRKGGYHLCLVEDREESFYLSVPEL